MKWLDSQTEFGALYGAMGLVIGAVINGFITRKSKLVDAQTVFQSNLIKRVEDMDIRIRDLEDQHNRDQKEVGALREQVSQLTVENTQLKARMDCQTCPLLKDSVMMDTIRDTVSRRRKGERAVRLELETEHE